MTKPVKLIVIGAGSRGSGYAEYAPAFPEQACIAGVAEPRDYYREHFAQRHHLPPESVFSDWREITQRPRFADAVLICTQDAMHAEPAIAFARMGYHILLEKPMAPNLADCRRIAEAAVKQGIIFAVCHVLRYTNYTRRLKEIIETGRIGQVISIQHLEPLGYWHQAHTYVRGNFRNTALSSPMLLSKACHDLDWIRHIVNERCVKISSFGNLSHFRKECRPAGSAERCLDCGIEAQCPYSAVRLYLGSVKAGKTGWPVNVLTPDVTPEGVTAALRAGPYGRCVYACDNDVVDHQVVNMEFTGGQTALFTMTGFTRYRRRQTRLFGTRGEIYGDGEKIQVYDFLTEQTEDIDPPPTPGGAGGGGALMRAFVAAVAQNNPALILSGPKETLETHNMVFAAEQSRNIGRVVTL